MRRVPGNELVEEHRRPVAACISLRWIEERYVVSLRKTLCERVTRTGGTARQCEFGHLLLAGLRICRHEPRGGQDRREGELRNDGHLEAILLVSGLGLGFALIVNDFLGVFRDSNSQLFGDYSIYLLGINDYLGEKK